MTSIAASRDLAITTSDRFRRRIGWTVTSSLLTTLICAALASMIPSSLGDDRYEVYGTDPLDIEAAGQRELVLHFPWKFRFPAIVRYQNLPQRMLNEPFLEAPGQISNVSEEFIQTWIRCFRSKDDLEIRIVATEHLARIARFKQADLSPIATELVQTLRETTDRRLMWACLSAIRDGDLKQTAAALTDLSETADDDVRQIVDPLLTRWQHKPAIDIWTSRLENPSSSMTSRFLACQALGQFDAVEPVTQISSYVGDRSATYQLRNVAATALSRLQPESARQLAETYLTGGMPEKLLAIELLNHSDEAAMDALFPLCRDPNPTVAVAAWEAVESHDPNRLLPLLNEGVQHPESGIRSCCTRLAALFPTRERMDTIFPLLGDKHLGVRNSCRQAFTSIPEDNPDLEQPIVDLIGGQLSKSDASWQITEQALYTLGSLRRPEFAEVSLPLCLHEKPEVFVAAAWLFHLMPEPGLKDEFREVFADRFQKITAPKANTRPDFHQLDQQIGLLFQAAGYCNFIEIQPSMTKQLDKESGLSERGRSAAIWAIGALNADSKDAAATKSMIDRLNDRNHPLVPEYDLVRRMAAQSLGRIGASSAVEDLKFAFTEDTPPTFIPQSARWSLQIMGEPSPGELPDSLVPLGTWKLQPLAPLN